MQAGVITARSRRLPGPTPLRSNAAKALITHVVIVEDVRLFTSIELDAIQWSRTSLIPGYGATTPVR